MTMKTKTCTQASVTARQPSVCVSVTTGAGIEGAVLSVFRDYDLPNEYGGRGVFKRCDHDGRKFATSDEAFAFALDRGYCQPFFMGLDWRARRTTSEGRALQLKSRERTLEWLAEKIPEGAAAHQLESLRKGAWIDWHRRDYASRLVRSVGYVRGRYANWLRRAIREHLIHASCPTTI